LCWSRSGGDITCFIPRCHLLGIRLVEHEVRNHRFDRHLHTPRAGRERGAQRRFAREVNDVSLGARGFEKGREPVRALGLDRLRTARLVPLGSCLPLGDQPLLQPADEFGVLAVRRHDHAQLPCQHQRLLLPAIVDAKGALHARNTLNEVMPSATMSRSCARVSR
jgi:hypothetical protein